MFSVVVSTVDESKLNSILLPSLEYVTKYLHDNKMPLFQLVVVNGSESLTKNYNDGMSKCTWKMKFFVHEDVDILDTAVPIFIRINNLINEHSRIGLVGLVGTTENPRGFWWNCSRDSIVGHVKCKDEYWKWKTEETLYDVAIVDGMFMATQTDIRFSEDITGFHFYDSDYSNKMRWLGYKVFVMPHLVDHRAETKDLSGISAEYYNKKWNL